MVLSGNPAGSLTLRADRVSGEIPFPSGQAVPDLPRRDEEVRTHRCWRATLEVHHLQRLHHRCGQRRPRPKEPQTIRTAPPGDRRLRAVHLLGPLQLQLYHGNDRAFRRRTSWCWQVPVPAPNPAARELDQVFIDGIWLHHDWVLLIARATTDVIGWQWAARESTTAYQALLGPIPPPQVATTDGAPGALKAITTTWPTTRIQRCLIHVRRDTVRDLTLRPRTTQGRALLGLSRKLLTITTTDQAAIWTTALNSYATEYRTWLNQRTTTQDDPTTAALTGKKWWYTHPRTRRAYQRLTRQNVLFTYLTCDDTILERTTNPVESINARIRDALRHHRGATPDHQAAIAEWTLHTYTHQPATPEQILTTWHAQGRPPRQRIPTTPTITNTTHPADWGTTPTPQEGL